MSYREALLSAIDGWNSDSISDEWLFESFREEFVDVMSASQAFEAVDETVDILLLEKDESTATEILQAIIGLARRSETTEIPRSLLIGKTAIQKKFEEFGVYAKNKLDELLQYYRL